MSAVLVADAEFRVKLPRKQGKIEHGFCRSVVYKLYGAYQFKIKHRRKDRNFSPAVPICKTRKEKWYRTMYRLSIDGRWYSPGNSKYVFFTYPEVAALMIDGGNNE